MIHLIKKFSALLLAVFLLCSFSSTASASEEEVRQFVNSLSERTLAIIKDSAVSSSKKEQELSALFTETIDTEWIGKFALGRYVRTITPEQLKRYQENYTKYLIINYVPNFRDYTGQTLKLTSISDTGKGTYLVQTEIVSPNGPSIRVDYRVRQKESSFKIYDIIAEGVSLITTQRAEFGSVLSQQGIDFLIAKLEKRISENATSSASAAQ